MNSFIEKINKYIVENGITFKQIIISSKFFPKSFNQVVLNELNNVNGNFTDDEIKEYKISYSNGGMELIVESKNNHSKLVIYSPKVKSINNCSGKRISESDLIEEAESLEKIECDKIEAKIIEACLSDRYQIVPRTFDDEIKDTIDHIADYLEYLQKEYSIKLQSIKNEKRVDIQYVTPESDRDVATGPRDLRGNSVAKERVNEIISIDERIRVLESYPYTYMARAYDKYNKKITYVCYAYAIDDNHFAIVLEPFSGIGYTKIVISSGTLNKKAFAALTQRALELSYSEVTSSKHIVRACHTSIGAYNSLMNEVVNSNIDEYNYNKYTVDKIRTLKGQ